jgi:hypothetical protein
MHERTAVVRTALALKGKQSLRSVLRGFFHCG